MLLRGVTFDFDFLFVSIETLAPNGQTFTVGLHNEPVDMRRSRSDTTLVVCARK